MAAKMKNIATIKKKTLVDKELLLKNLNYKLSDEICKYGS